MKLNDGKIFFLFFSSRGKFFVKLLEDETFYIILF